jgi:hypothetical protein
MKLIHNSRITIVTPIIGAFLALSAGGSEAAGKFGTESLYGDFVISADGGFVAMTPFAPGPLRLSVALVGRLTFDGIGQVGGEWTVVFHNAAVPVGIRSHFEPAGTYYVASNGHLFIDVQEFKVEPPAADDGIADAIVGFECYIVQRQKEARCILHTLISLQQGSDPVPEPITLSGSLLRQR